MRPLRDQYFVLDDKGHWLIEEIVVFLNKEIKVYTNLVFRLDIFRTTFNFFALLFCEELHPEIPLYLMFLLIGRIDQVNPENIWTYGTVAAFHLDYFII
jgi:hypothetical protein